MIRPMRNRLASLAIAGFLASSALVPSVAAAAPQGHWSQEALNLAAQRGLLEGAADSIDPDETVTRGMFVTLLGRLDGGELPSEAPHFFRRACRRRFCPLCGLGPADFHCPGRIRPGFCTGTGRDPPASGSAAGPLFHGPRHSAGIPAGDAFR